jgi:hypothetical protein
MISDKMIQVQVNEELIHIIADSQNRIIKLEKGQVQTRLVLVISFAFNTLLIAWILFQLTWR